MKLLLNNNIPINQQFDNLANEVFNQWILKVNQTTFKIIELEMYYYSKTLNHLDGFTHPHNRFEKEFRFHHAGVDITFNSNPNDYGGMLIRSIQNLNNQQITNGPRRTLATIFETFGKITQKSTIQLIKTTSPANYLYIKTKRVGLNSPNRKTPDHNRYKNSHYRYITALVKENRVDNKENAARDIKDPTLRKQFLGYNIN